ncbi:hypothetical protein GQ54DRAFT_58632 [Martensiomyces pterosporus]|nr:hypothetical protein GQ54DRAFT_58632 [Martensiomyces pterosporus]
MGLHTSFLSLSANLLFSPFRFEFCKNTFYTASNFFSFSWSYNKSRSMQKRKTVRPSPLGLGLKKPLGLARNKQQAKQSEGEETAKVLEDLTASFKADGKEDDGKLRLLVKSSDQAHAAGDSVKQGPQRPSVFSAGDDNDDSGADAELREEEELMAAKEASGKKKRNLDLFLEELKQGQEQRQRSKQSSSSRPSRPSRPSRQSHSDRHRADGASEGASVQGLQSDGRMPAVDHPPDADDGVTTNLYIGNIHPEVDEQALCLGFAKYGPIGSVKIMWPRTPEEHARKRNSGFVSFMDRECAARAIRGMDKETMRGYTLRVCWGKRVPIPPRPIFALDCENPTVLPLTGYPFNAVLPVQPRGGFGHRMVVPGENDDGVIPEVRVERPLDHRLVRTIHWTVEHVAKHGAAFECALIAQKRGDPRFEFLVSCESKEHVYYRWRLYSLLNGDTKTKWRDKMFFMYDGGPIWIPPEIGHTAARGKGSARVGDAGALGCGASESSSEADEAEENGRDDMPKDRLGGRARDRLERRIRRIRRPECGVIADAMAFSIDHAYAAEDVADIICQSLLDTSASAADKVCRLLLISDILHNCSAPVASAWRLRQVFEVRLDEIFGDLLAVYRGIEARLKAEHFRKQVLGVLAVWEAWMVFPQTTTGRLAEGFLV